ncbi:MAG: transposase [Negativicutes bacterium]|nr:transposase [Negativicutes bacterium]
MEDAIYDSYARRKFMGSNFPEKQVPDATTLLHFRRPLEKNGIGKLYFDTIKNGLEKCGRSMRGGTVVDAAIIAAPSPPGVLPTNAARKCIGPKRETQWHFGVKRHAGADEGPGYTHTFTAAAANTRDIDQPAELIREDDTAVYRDAAYLGLNKREEVGNNFNKPAIEYRINLRPEKVNALADGPAKD